AIHAQRDALTPTERRIAGYLLEQTQSVALLSVQELAVHLHTGPACIIRVVQKLGYTGLSELKKGLKRDLHKGLSPLEQFRLNLDAGETASLSEVAAIARQEARNIAATMSLLDEVTFRSAADILSQAHGVYLLGVGVSAHLAGLAAFVLQHIGLRCFALQHTGLNVSEQLVRIGKGDALFAFSFPPYSLQTIEAAALAKKRGACVVSVTNQAIAPIARHSDAVLVAKTDTLGPSNSVSAPMVLVHGLAAAIAASSRPRSLKAMEATLSIRKEE
ncbi:MAG TPA: MurR/RpiR family transcriptional regulator, partial [Vicinamibacterales bacterium]